MVREKLGEKNNFQGGAKVRENLDIVSVRNNSANSIYVALKILEIVKVGK